MSRKLVNRSVSIAVVVAASAFLGSIVLKSPSYDRQWKTEYRLLPHDEIAGNMITVRKFSQLLLRR